MSMKRSRTVLGGQVKVEGTFNSGQTRTIKEVVTGQLAEEMQEQPLSKTRLAAMLNTSPSRVDRLLDPTCDVTLSTLQRAAAFVGRKVQIELV